MLGDHFRVIGLDARGHGGSEWTRDYSFELMRDDVVRFMEQLGVLAAIIIGHAMERSRRTASSHATRAHPVARALGDADTGSGQSTGTVNSCVSEISTWPRSTSWQHSQGLA